MISGGTPVETTFQEIQCGLMMPRKQLPSKLFYDARGSELFDQICELPEYYPTRTELVILQENIEEIRARISSGCVLIEYGSGTSTKTRLLLDHLDRLAAYVPIDISEQLLETTAVDLAREYSEIRIIPIHADYTKEFTLPEFEFPFSHRAVFFPGSTIGNFTPPDARDFLSRIAEVVGAKGGLLIGVDLKKDVAVLDAAYNDSAGVTAEFNLNMLAHINREYGTDFDLSRFQHKAFYNECEGRVEMHLVSMTDQEVRVNGITIPFRVGETIHTENSYKYTVEEFRLLVEGVFDVRRVWMDGKRLFSVLHLVRGK